jgi:hypothetical protein
MNIFNRKLTDKYLMNKLGNRVYLRNGHGFGFISTHELYDNKFIEIGFGYIVSGYGDWGGGFSHASSHALKITINSEFIIQNVETDSFYNSKSDSEERAELAKKLAKKIKIGDKLILKNEDLIEHLNKIFSLLPHKHNIGYDVFEHPHMLGTYIKDHEDDVRLDKEMKEWELQWENEDKE